MLTNLLTMKRSAVGLISMLRTKLLVCSLMFIHLLVWGPRGEINDYATKAWSGLVGMIDFVAIDGIRYLSL